MTRRRFVSALLATVAALSVLNMGKCSGGANDLLNSLRNILKTVEASLTKLTALGSLLPDVVHQVSQYLSAVTAFVYNAASLLEADTITTAEKARQIIALASSVVLPAIPNPKVTAILGVVAAAVDVFLRYFGASTAHPSITTTLHTINLSESDHRYLATIESQANADRFLIHQWTQQQPK